MTQIFHAIPMREGQRWRVRIITKRADGSVVAGWRVNELHDTEEACRAACDAANRAYRHAEHDAHGDATRRA